jgi:broad specificity phosphatase PhoE
MQIVFVRHAISINHESGKRQAPETRLGVLGKKQARKLADRIKKSSAVTGLNYECVITSDWTRATETAEIVADKLKIPLVKNSYIHEYLSNKILQNQLYDSDIVKKFQAEAIKKGIDFDWKFRGGGECLRDVIDRVVKFRKHLQENYDGKNVLVVSHGLFITAFVTVLLLGDDYKDEEFDRVSKMIHLENTSITHLEYDPGKKVWKIHSVNDAGHVRG